nr:transposase [Ruminococcus albus]
MYKSKGNKTLAISHKFKELRAESLENITTEFGKQLRMNRSIQAEGVFGVLKQDHDFRRFLWQGQKYIKTEFLLLGLAYNIKRVFC